MNDKSILIVGGGLLQVPAVEIAHSMGLKIAVTDRNPDCVCAPLADKFFALDTKDAAGHAALAVELKRDWSLVGVFTEGASVEVTVAEAAHAAGLPGLPPAVARQIANKGCVREILTAAGIPQPRFAVTVNHQDALNAARRIGFPVVVKATDNSGSRGLTKVSRAGELSFEVFQRARAASSDYTVIIEELLMPIDTAGGEIAEQSVETVWHWGEGHWLNWVDRPFVGREYDPHPSPLPCRERGYAVERGHYNPAQHPAETQRQVEEMVLAAGRALGMTTGIFKCDVILIDKGPRILECTARLSGGFDAQYTSPLAHGVNYIRGAMCLALGDADAVCPPYDGIDWDDFLPRWHRHAAALAAFPEPGRITAIRGIEEAKQINGVEHIFCRMQTGDVIAPYTTCVERPLFVIASGDTRRDAVNAAEMALGLIQLKTETK